MRTILKSILFAGLMTLSTTAMAAADKNTDKKCDKTTACCKKGDKKDGACDKKDGKCDKKESKCDKKDGKKGGCCKGKDKAKQNPEKSK